MAVQTKDNIKKELCKKYKFVSIFNKDKNGKKVVQKEVGIFLGTYDAKLSASDSKKMDNEVDKVNWFLKELGGKQTSGNEMTFAGGDKGNFNINVILDWYENESDKTENYFIRIT